MLRMTHSITTRGAKTSEESFKTTHDDDDDADALTPSPAPSTTTHNRANATNRGQVQTSETREKNVRKTTTNVSLDSTGNARHIPLPSTRSAGASFLPSACLLCFASGTTQRLECACALFPCTLRQSGEPNPQGIPPLSLPFPSQFPLAYSHCNNPNQTIALSLPKLIPRESSIASVDC